ncbi:MAG: Pyridoxine/pyridoxamine 5'-phosphate oxidase [Chlamydiae bacterium]|nr:Pyridoxine/pyridoxamine 5'-phosphate oxidase [Chlamydiota bacterium]
MKRSIEKLREEYGKRPILEEELKSDPCATFLLWLKAAVQAEVMEPNGMVLSTVSESGKPSSRMVLLKGVEQKKLVFYTNYKSRKAKQLVTHPYGSLTFWWKEIHRQVTIEGKVAKVSRSESRDYFAKRPKGAQLAALASHQSDPLASRLELEEEFYRLKENYRGKEVPCPPTWGGYALTPDRFEFWQGRADRLHDRFAYIGTNGEWLLTRLAP